MFYTFEPLQCKRLMRANLQLAKWARVGHLPSLDEYLDVAGVEIAIYFTLAGVMLAMDNICKDEAYEWLKSRDKLVRAMTIKARVANDMFGYEVRPLFLSNISIIICWLLFDDKTYMCDID